MRASRILCIALAGWLAATGAAAAVKVIDLPAFDMVYSSRTGLLYVSVSDQGGERANTVTAIDPKLGQIVASVPVGRGPLFLALSDDQKVLYVSLHSGAGAVSRVDLSSFTVTQTIPTGIPSDLAVQPGNSNVIAVVTQSGVVIFDNGVRRPNTTGFGEYVSRLEFSSDPGTLYGYNSGNTESGFRTLKVDSQGVSVLSVARDLIPEFSIDIEYASGLIFSTSGDVVNPVTLSRLGTFPVDASPEFGDSVLPEPGKDRVLFLNREGISTFRLSTFSLIDSTPLPPEALERGASLVRWGDDGLAFLTPESNQVLLLSEEGFGTPPPPAGPWLSTGALPGFRAKVRINGATQGRNVLDCIAETLCVSGALAGRPEIFVKVIGPRPNGFLWTQISRFTPSKVEIWLQQESTSKINYYLLDPVPTSADNVSGLLDRRAFLP